MADFSICCTTLSSLSTILPEFGRNWILTQSHPHSLCLICCQTKLIDRIGAVIIVFGGKKWKFDMTKNGLNGLLGRQNEFFDIPSIFTCLKYLFVSRVYFYLNFIHKFSHVFSSFSWFFNNVLHLSSVFVNFFLPKFRWL